MAKASWLVVLLLVGCTSRLDSTEPRHYACNPTSPCPEGWACGSAGYCFEKSDGKPYACAIDDHCADGWRCGVAGQCFDNAVGSSLLCEEDGDCGGGWKCGVEERCFDPAVGLPSRCDRPDDCGGGWSCGLNGICYDRAVATDIACRVDAGPADSECAPTWRCGLEGKCHERDAGAPYLCASDDDCEAQWRCSFEGRCVDMRAFGLRDNPMTSSAEKVSPAWAGATPHLAVEFEQGAPRVALVDGGALITRRGLLVFSRALPGGRTPAALALIPTGEVYATDDAGVWLYGSAGQQALLVNNAAALRDGTMKYSPTYPAEVAGFSGVSAGIALVGNGYVSDVTDGGRVVDLAAAPNMGPFVTGSCSGNCNGASYIAATETGLYFAPRGASTSTFPVFFRSLPTDTTSLPAWRPMGLPGSAGSGCADGGAPLAGVKYSSSSPPSVVTLDQTGALRMYTRTGALVSNDILGACPDLGMKTTEGPCAACAPGETAASFEYSVAPGSPVRVICTGGDAGVTIWNVRLAQGCGRNQLPATGAVQAGFTRVRSAYTDRVIDADGMPWQNPTSEFLTDGLPLLDDVFHIAGGGDGGMAAWNWYAGSNPTVTRWMEGVGLVWAPPSTPTYKPVGSIVQRPDIVIQGFESAGVPGSFPLIRPTRYTWSSGTGDLANSGNYQPLDRSRDEVEAFGSSYQPVRLRRPIRAHSRLATTSAGVEWLVIGLDDRVWAQPSAAALSQPVSAQDVIPIRVVPVPYSEISSLAAFGGPGTQPMTVYVVAGHRLIRVDVRSDAQWIPTEISVPGAVPIAVFSDGDRGRVGVEDGRVFALPIPVPIAPLLPHPVLDFSELCGNAFALTTKALYRLAPGDGQVGTWVRVPLEQVAAGMAPIDPKFVSRLHRADKGEVQELYVFSKRGSVVKLSAQCQ